MGEKEEAAGLLDFLPLYGFVVVVGPPPPPPTQPPPNVFSNEASVISPSIHLFASDLFSSAPERRFNGIGCFGGGGETGRGGEYFLKTLLGKGGKMFSFFFPDGGESGPEDPSKEEPTKLPA